MNRVKRGFGIIAAIIIAVIALMALLANFYTDIQWFREVGYLEVFWTTFKYKVILFAVFFIISALFLYLNLFIVRKNYLAYLKRPRVEEDYEDEDPKVRYMRNFQNWRSQGLLQILSSKWSNLIIAVISIFFGLFTSQVFLATATFNKFVLFLHRVDFNLADPLLKHDVSFYTHFLPFLQVVYNYGLTLTILTLAITAAIYLMTNLSANGGYLSRGFTHVAVLVAFLLVIVAGGYYIKTALLVFSPRGAAFGASYTDVHVTLPYYRIAIFIALAGALVALYSIRKKNLKLLLIAPALIIAAGFASTGVAAIIQNYNVEANELVKEREYLKHNIAFTREAYNIKATEREFPAENTLTAQDLEDNAGTIDNVRILDARPALTTYNQLQSIRPYYQFYNVDVDRYYIDGDYTQVLIAARELKLNEGTTWVNRHILYTHGFGVVASPVNEVSSQGLPNYLIKDIPPVSVKGLEVKQPRIYFGERTDDFIIVQANTPELDYPQGEDNARFKYDGKAGISLNGLNRLILAFRERSLKLLVSGELTPQSRVILFRNIEERVRKIAPFLSYENNKYLVIGKDGKLYWIIDAYTTTNNFPYSQPYNGNINYIRNSVKVTVDAYDGDVNFYIADSNDPLIKSYAATFPGLFKDLEEMPEDLRAHIRYPVGLFQIQARILRSYHMTNPDVFYNKEDLWDIATENYSDEIQEVQPYYVMMKLSKEQKEEFILMLPMTPANKNIMISWLAVRNDGENYGELLLYKFPKRKSVFGPQQFEARIDQDPEISSLLTLLGQKGSSVIRGNTLVIPVNESLLYVEPLYIQATSGEGTKAIPEVRKVIVGYGDNLVMRNTFREALDAIFGGAPEPEPEPGIVAPEDVLSTDELIDKANDLYDRAQESLRQGDWAQYGRLMDQLKEVLQQMQQRG